LHGKYSEPSGLDLILNIYADEDCVEWSENACGRVHYLDEDGSEIFQVPIQNNTLTLVYRTEEVGRFLENVKGTGHVPLFQVIGSYVVGDV
jgi:hypothetical protein